MLLAKCRARLPDQGLGPTVISFMIIDRDVIIGICRCISKVEETTNVFFDGTPTKVNAAVCLF